MTTPPDPPPFGQHTASAPASQARAGWMPAPARPGGGQCYRTWALTPGGMVVRTPWHEPAKAKNAGSYEMVRDCGGDVLA
ncbi:MULTISPECIES: hypothetical protein [unclassified Kitasatospora]|uniref:hypothetical protein n=1 Tax=unclassified Kitasatospora TaxID=2633591 RepID=UPI003406EE56